MTAATMTLPGTGPADTAPLGTALLNTAPGGTAPERAAGPLRRVLAALDAGVAERSGLTRFTGLGDEAIDSALAHLVRTGHVRATSLGACPPAGCAACPSAGPGSNPACGAGTARRPGAPVALSLVRRRAE